MEEKYKQKPSDCIKIVLFGPESTGKTTLSKQLAKHYHTAWVPEYAREYLQEKWDNKQKTCEPQDLLPIAEGQMKLENKLAKKTNTVLICDTNLLETKVYSEIYYSGTCDPILKKYALKNIYHLYFLTYIDTPWKADDLRDRPTQRESIFNAFQNTLVKYKKPYVLLKGNQKERLKTAIKHIDKILKTKQMKLTEKDIQQIKNKGLSVKEVNNQIEVIKSGASYSNLISAATIKNGIESYNENETIDFINSFESKRNNLSIVKFVPASGAATRMFKFLFQFLKDFNENEELKLFFKSLQSFPFYDDLIIKTKAHNSNFDSLSKNEQKLELVKTLLDSNRLNFSAYPKGLLPFHKYKNDIKTAFQEHLFEATLYASFLGNANLHFTVSKNHFNLFKLELDKVKEILEQKTNTAFNVSFSFQKEATETLALTIDNSIFKNDDGSILFRPSGHGALLENLNDLNYDLIFIKNIDNIVVSNKNKEISKFKKLLAGVLLKNQEQIFSFLHQLDSGSTSEKELIEIAMFLSNKINTSIDSNFEDYPTKKKIDYLRSKLNRPIRVCGMVKNEGEPGGGPFWVKDENNNTSLQIVEFAQIDHENTSQANIVKNATHFNPTDLVCGVKNYKGGKFDLTKFVDHKAAFITMKTQNGKNIKALELPGLWNGSMAFWNTILVEVPLNTFNPVKTVNDLLKPEHQGFNI